MYHLGLFPEQLPHWQWMLERLGEVRGETPRVLNLFAYTGAASLIAAQAGAEVTHVDASKRAIAWAKQNQAVSKLGEAPIRWILDDARKFVAREVRRGKSYHVILVDPPKFGRGPEGEVWDVFLHLAPLLRDCVLLLAPGRASLVLTTLRHPCLGAGDGRPGARMPGGPSGHDRERRAGRGRGGRRAAAANLPLHPMDLDRCHPLSRAAACARSPACRTSA